MDAAVKKKLLDAAKSKLKKQFGEDFILDAEKPQNYEVIPSGSLLFDQAVGNGGIPLARITEVFGLESCGKTTLATCLMVQAQKKYPDRMVLFLDLEQAFSPEYARQFGLDTSSDKFMFIQPGSYEEAFTSMEELIATGLFSLVVYDSVPAGLPQYVLEKGLDQETIGVLAKKLSTGLNRLKNVISEANTAVLFINQMYEKISFMGGTDTKGGKSLKYYSSIRIQLTKRDLVADDDNKDKIAGQGLKFQVRKNKVAEPYKTGETMFYFGKGFDTVSEVVDVAVEKGFISKGGAWFTFTVDNDSKKPTEMKFQGKDKVVAFFRESEKDYQYYLKLVQDSLANVVAVDEKIVGKDEED